jgi:hypothetical protein
LAQWFVSLSLFFFSFTTALKGPTQRISGLAPKAELQCSTHPIPILSQGGLEINQDFNFADRNKHMQKKRLFHIFDFNSTFGRLWNPGMLGNRGGCRRLAQHLFILTLKSPTKLIFWLGSFNSTKCNTLTMYPAHCLDTSRTVSMLVPFKHP